MTMLLRTAAAALIAAPLLTATPAHAGDIADLSATADPAAAETPAASENEYATAPDGLLLTPTQRRERLSPKKDTELAPGDVAPDARLDPQILTHSLEPLENKSEQAKDAKILSMLQIEEAYTQGKYEEILPPLEEAADQNNPQAALLLGIMLDDGQGIAANPARATDLYTRAAEANLPQAQHRLALQYYQGKGVAKDLLRAMMWLHIAAATYKEGPQKQRASADRDNLNTALSRKDRETALFMAREWMTKKGTVRLLDAEQQH